MSEALFSAFSLQMAYFADPFNVSASVQCFCSEHGTDRPLGGFGNSYDWVWNVSGEFNPVYENDLVELRRALAHTAASVARSASAQCG